MTDAASPTLSRRRRSRRSTRTPWQRFYDGMPMVAFMGAVSLVLAAGSLFLFSGAVAEYAGIVMGWSRPDVDYGFGAPQAQQRTAEGEILTHRRGGVAIITAIGPQGAHLVRCEGAETQGTCPSVFGIGGGTSEADVWRRMGHPSRILYTNGRKTLVYDAVGVSFALSRFAVVNIEVKRVDPGIGAFLARWFRVTLP